MRCCSFVFFLNVEKMNVWTCDSDSYPPHFSPAAAQSGDGGGVDWLRDAGSSLWHGETLHTCSYRLGDTIWDEIQNKFFSNIHKINVSTVYLTTKWRTDLILNIDCRVTLFQITDVDQSAERLAGIKMWCSLSMHRGEVLAAYWCTATDGWFLYRSSSAAAACFFFTICLEFQQTDVWGEKNIHPEDIIFSIQVVLLQSITK